jgi:hypothetical protein
MGERIKCHRCGGIVGCPDDPKYSVVCPACGVLLLGVDPVQRTTWRPAPPPPSWLRPAVKTIGWLALVLILGRLDAAINPLAASGGAHEARLTTQMVLWAIIGLVVWRW